MAELQMTHYLASLKANLSACLAKHDTHSSRAHHANIYAIKLHCVNILLPFCVYACVCLVTRTPGVGDDPKNEHKDFINPPQMKEKI